MFLGRWSPHRARTLRSQVKSTAMMGQSGQQNYSARLGKRKRDSPGGAEDPAPHAEGSDAGNEPPQAEESKKDESIASKMEPWTASEGQLRKLMLKRILKENHGADINQIAFNFRRRSMLGDSAQISAEMLVGDSPNIVATVGGPQANIYDNEHDVDHLDIMSHFVLAGEAGATGGTSSAGELRTCCWLRSPHDAILAVAGTSGVIHILSLAFSAELRQLQGHSGTVHDLQAHPMDDDILLSVASDGTARLWHVPSGQCLASLLIDRPSAICFQPSGEGFLVATSRGDVWNCSVPNEIGLLRKQLASVQADGEWASIEALRLAVDACGSKMKLHPGEIDSIVATDDCFLCKSTNGKIVQVKWDGKSIEHTYQLRNGTSNRCRLDVSNDGRYMCVGSAKGEVSVFNIRTHSLVTDLTHKRSTKPIRCCAFSLDARNVLFAGENAFIWRFDYPRQ